MTATDPRPQLAAMLLERLAPAAEALAEACAQDIDAGPPPEDDRDRAEYHRAGRAGLAHLRQLLAVLDWSAKHLPEPEPEEEEYEYLGEVWTGSRTTPEYYAWLERLNRREDRREERRRKREEKERKERKKRKAKKRALAAQAGGGGDGGEECRRPPVGADGAAAPSRRPREGGAPSPMTRNPAAPAEGPAPGLHEENMTLHDTS